MNGEAGKTAISTLRKKIDLLETELASAADAEVKFRLHTAIQEARAELARLTAHDAIEMVKSVDVGRVDRYAPTELVGRDDELAMLEAAWRPPAGAPTPNVACIVALGGEGKTSLVGWWLSTLAARDWDDAQTVFAWSFYSQGTREHGGASSDLFLSAALRFFGDEAMASSASGPYEKGQRLAQLAGRRRSLLVLDGVEPLQYPPTHPQAGRLTDAGLQGLLSGLASHDDGLCVVTTRYRIEDLRAQIGKTVVVHELDRLSADAGAALLRTFDLRGADAAFQSVVSRVRGHALALTVLGAYARDAFGGDVSRLDAVELAGADEADGGHAFRAIDAYTTWLDRSGEEGRQGLAALRVAGLFDRPVAAELFDAVTAGDAIEGITGPLMTLAAPDRNVVLSRLERARLVSLEWDTAGRLIGFDAHPLVREYFANHLRTTNPGAWRAAHDRIYEHLCASATTGTEPTLEELGPLYQAIVHGCHAGRHQEACSAVYWDRICQGDRYYSTKMLGAVAADLGAIACFFSRLWDQPHPDLDPIFKSWLPGQAAFRLHHLGRLAEARAPMAAGLSGRVEKAEWGNASALMQNLCDLWIADGNLAAALHSADQATTYATRDDDLVLQQFASACRGAVLSRAGRYDDAIAAFTTACHLHHKREPDERWMYSQAGFQECDLALAELDLAHWCHQPIGPTAIAAINAFADRAARTRQIAERNGWLRDIGLDSVTLARTQLYIARNSGDPSPTATIDHAVAQLRSANDITILPLALLTRARIHHHNGDHDMARADLDETFEISSREPMRLHLCDTHLLRAHLFHDHGPYPWDHPTTDLDTAQALITATGYLHRQPFLDHTRTLVKPDA